MDSKDSALLNSAFAARFKRGGGGVGFNFPAPGVMWLGKTISFYFSKKMVHNSSETGEGSLKIDSSTKGRLCHIILSHLMFRVLIS